jgi:hypothetical protein
VVERATVTQTKEADTLVGVRTAAVGRHRNSETYLAKVVEATPNEVIFLVPDLFAINEPEHVQVIVGGVVSNAGEFEVI